MNLLEYIDNSYVCDIFNTKCNYNAYNIKPTFYDTYLSVQVGMIDMMYRTFATYLDIQYNKPENIADWYITEHNGVINCYRDTIKIVFYKNKD